MCRTLFVKSHNETNNKSLSQKTEPEQKEFMAYAKQERNKQSTFMTKYVIKNSDTSAASLLGEHVMAQYGKPFV